MIAKCPKPPKYNEKQRNTVRCNERGDRVSQNIFEKSDNDIDQNIYSSMARMSVNENNSSEDFCDSS